MPTGLGGSTPQFNTGGMLPGQKALFHSLRDIALIKDKTIKPGFGVVYAGTIMATAEDGLLVPCAPTAVAITDQSRAFGVADVTVADAIMIPIASSYMFAVGDEVILADNVPAYTDGGAIVSIDRETYPGIALVTFTNAGTATLANQCHIYHKAGAAGKFSDATFLCDQDVFTGEDMDAKGANTSVVISNAILYLSALIGYDAAAATALGGSTDGPHVILK